MNLRIIANTSVFSLLAGFQLLAQATSCPSSPTSALSISSSCDTTIDVDAANSPATLIINSGASVSTLGRGISVDGAGTITTFTNSGLISADALGGGSRGVYNAGTITNFTNSDSGEIQAGTGVQVYNDTTGSITNLKNYGTVYGLGDTAVENLGTINTLNNLGTIKTDGLYGISNSGTITTLTNSGTISSNPSDGISNSGTITTLTNSGTITGYYYGIANNGGVIQNLTNTGTIKADINAGIYNWTAASIVTLNNSQGAGASAGALTYEGKLPTNYNIIINSATQYGRLSGAALTGSTNFGVYAGSIISSRLYTSVLQGLTSSNVGATRIGTYDGMTWTLALQGASSTMWDLSFAGASTSGTQQSLVNTVQPLQSTFTILNTALTNSFTYDCNVFGANDVCVSAGGRNTAVSAANGLNSTSALLIAAYRLHPNYRVGAYADQNLSVNNAGSTVNLGNNTPLIGLFGAWNERLDGVGTEVKVSMAYGQKNATVNRQIVGLSQAGSGGAPINSQGAQVAVKHGFAVTDNTIVYPYAGVRYTQNNMGGYTEGASSSVTAPLTYSALNTNATTALAGVGASYRFIPQASLFVSAGVETDTNIQNGSINATGVSGLTPVNLNANPVKTRPTISVGTYYDIEKSQRFGVAGIYRQEAYQATATTTVMATYTVGL